MKSLGLKITSIFLAFSIMLSSPAIIIADDTQLEDTAYTEAVEVLEGLNLIDTSEKNSNIAITRGQFADLLAKALGLKNLNEEQIVAKSKFLGYTNNPEFDENGDWVWKENSSGSSVNVDYEHATPFKDVLSTHQYWESISLMASLGLMTGDENKYFRPNDTISYIEAQKVLVYACGSAEKAGNVFPGGIVTEAARLGITDGFKKSAADDVTYRDAVVLIYNALNANVYEAISYNPNGVEYKKSKVETLLSYYTGIYKLEGIVDKNRFTSLKNTNGTDSDLISVDGTLLKTGDVSFDSLLGYDVDAYYKDEKSSVYLTAVYVRNSGRSSEITVNSEDIIGYSSNKLSYQLDGEKKKEKYIGANTNIIYNGKALTDYTGYSDKILVPEQGNIIFVDGDSNGSYETVFVNNIETVVVSSVDYEQKIIYNKMNNPKSVELDSGMFFITDEDGLMYELTDITVDSVLDVRRTLNTQGEQLAMINRSYSSVTGVVTVHNTAKKQIIVNDKVYEYSDLFDTSLIVLGTTITFYINTRGKIAYAIRGSELTYAYLVDIAYDGFGDGEKIWLYDLWNEEFIEFNFANNVKVNKVSVKKDKIAGCTAIYNSSAEKTLSQLIKYKINGSGDVCEILTANVDEDEFVEQDLGSYKGEELMYRNAVKAFVAKTSVVYMAPDAIYSAVPETNAKNQKLYYEPSISDNDYYRVDRVYKNSSKSALASVILIESDVEDSLATKRVITGKGAPISMVMGVRKTINADGDEGVIVEVMNGKDGYFALESFDDDIAIIASELHEGDLIRYETRNRDGSIYRLLKVFDAKDKIWTVGANNPYATSFNSTAAFNSSMHGVHGVVAKKYDGGKYITVAPYVYKKDESGNTVKSGISTDESTYFTYCASDFKVYKYTSERDGVVIGNPISDLISVEEAGVGTEVVVYVASANPRSIFVYK